MSRAIRPSLLPAFTAWTWLRRAGPAAAALALLCLLQLACLLRAPAAWMPAQVSVALASGAGTSIPFDALGLPRQEAGQLGLRRDADGAWWVANVGARPLVLQRGSMKRKSGSVRLAQGVRFQLGANGYAVDEAGAGGVRLRSGTRYWDYDGATLRRDGQFQPACPDARLASRLVAAWNRLAPGVLAIARPLVFGGNLDCGNRIGVKGLPAPAALLTREPDGLLLAAASAPLLYQDAAGSTLLAEREERLDGVQALVLGRTRLMLQQNGDLLHLQPAGHVALYGEPQARQPEGVSWSWTERTYFTLPPQALLPGAGIVAAGLLAALAVLWPRRTRLHTKPRPARSLALEAALAVVLGGFGLLLLVLQKSGAPAGVGVVLLLGWAALWAMLLLGGGSGIVIAGVLLLAVGLLAQLELGLAGGASSWLRHFQKTGTLLAIGAGAGMLWACLRRLRGPGLPAQARVELALLLASALALAMLVLQVIFGDETGVFDLQPVEFAKLALCALTAHCLALAAGGESGQRGQRDAGGALLRALRVAAPALLFLAVLAVALVQVDDYSPLVLLGVWAGAMALAHACATGQRLLASSCLCAAAGAAFIVVLLREAGPEGLAQWNFYADRFQVWLAPGTHPHTGQQLLLGARAVAGGGWWGADGVLGVASLGQDAQELLRIPAVQDDFAPSFFLNRHGLASALVLWLLQALFLAAILRTALRCWLAASRARDWRQAWLARFRYYLLCGGGAFVFGHFLLSWGTNLAIFPVMGQPMSFLSAGGSHLLFFICPLLAFGAASCQSLEETESCPA